MGGRHAVWCSQSWLFYFCGEIFELQLISAVLLKYRYTKMVNRRTLANNEKPRDN